MWGNIDTRAHGKAAREPCISIVVAGDRRARD